MPGPEGTARLARRAGLNDQLLRALDELATVYPVWVVGGAVNAWLAGRFTPDVDVVTTAPAAALRRRGFVPIGGHHGTVALRRGDQRLEATPLDVELKENLLDRDFTAWAVALPWPGGAPIDPATGLTDRERRLLRTPRAPAETLDRDPVRILRALRRRAEGYRLHVELAATIGRFVDRLSQEPPERIGGEWLKLLDAPMPGAAIRLAAAWPELVRIVTGVASLPLLRGHPAGHTLTIWAHTARLVDTLPKGPLRLAAFFHDLTKPAGPGHAARSAELADETLRRWACPKAVRRHVVRLIAQHSFRISSLLADRRALRRWIAENEDLLPDLLRFRVADRAAAGTLDRRTRHELELFSRVVRRETATPWPRSPRELDLDAAELFTAIACPRALRAHLLDALWEWVLAAPASRNRRSLLHDQAARLLDQLPQKKRDTQ